jgi:hypothetical protein
MGVTADFYVCRRLGHATMLPVILSSYGQQCQVKVMSENNICHHQL